MRVLLIAVVGALAISAVVAGGVLGATSHQKAQLHPPRLWIAHAGLRERATLGSYCLQRAAPDGSSNGACGDSAYPLPTHGRLPVRPGSRVVLRPSVEPSTVQAHLIRPKGSTFVRVGHRLRVKRLSAHRWAVVLPARLRGAHLLDVFLRWDNARDGSGDADFWGAMRQSCT